MGQSSDVEWRTAISTTHNDQIMYRGYHLNDIISELSFTEVIYLLLQGDVPDNGNRRMLDAMFVAVADHGVSLSQGLSRYIISCGSPLQASIATGVLTIGDHHAGAGTFVADLFEEYMEDDEFASVTEGATTLVEDHLERGEPVPGYGHPTHTGGDPRARILEEIAIKEEIADSYVEFALEVEEALAQQVSKRIPINIDGISAAILLDMEFSPDFARGYLIIGRVPGLVAHAIEESEREDPYRLLGGEKKYDGPENRDFKTNRKGKSK
ncbi:citryl-CoA lyase [Natronorubrum sp. FCH18a]|uniref:citryl-CoA lyase n=1 Tax=Natronorubrum sp. FCH18a TaxID=3447018 RepID=UPI003F51188D